MIEWLVIALSLAGLVISIYFTFAYYGRIKKSRWIPEILCAREGSSCVTVVQTPHARVFGVPNSLLGIFHYIVILSMFGSDAYFGGLHPLTWVLFYTVMVGSVVAISLGAYLIYVLRWKLHIKCPLCYAAHTINLAIFALFLFAMR